MADEIHATVIKPIQQDVHIRTFGGPQGSTVCSICFGYNDTPILPSEQTPAYTADYVITLSNALSVATCETASTGSSVFTILKNGVTIGTVTFPNGSLTGTVSLSDTGLVRGDRLKLVAPASTNATLFLPSITISGNR